MSAYAYNTEVYEISNIEGSLLIGYILKPSPQISNIVSNNVQQSSQTAKFGLSEQNLMVFEETRNEHFRGHCCTAMLMLFERCGESFA